MKNATMNISKKFEIITGSPLRIWYLTKFAGYEISYLTWEPKLFGGFRIRKRLVQVGDFPLARKPSSVAPRAQSVCEIAPKFWRQQLGFVEGHLRDLIHVGLGDSPKAEEMRRVKRSIRKSIARTETTALMYRAGLLHYKGDKE